MRTTQFDLTNSVNYIDEKTDLPYEENINKVFDYLKLSTLKRSKYDNSIFLVIFPKEENKIIIGKRNNINVKYNLKDVKYDYFNNKINEINALKYNKNLNKNNLNYFTFNFQGSNYIGDAEFSNAKIRKDFKRENVDFVQPIMITADRDDEFSF